MKHTLLFSIPLSVSLLAACSASGTTVTGDAPDGGGASSEAGARADGGTSSGDAAPQPAGPVPVKWTSVPFPEAGGVKQVAAISATDAYAVTYSTLFHYDGSSWSPVTLPSGHNSLSGVVATSSKAVYVLTSGQADVYAFDGSAWSVLGRGTEMTNGYSVIAFGSEVWVGTQWNFYRSALHRWNGSAWSDIDIGDSQDGVLKLSGTSSSDLWGVRTGVVGHFDGTAWTDTAVPASAISARAKDDVFAVGKTGAIQHFDGASWSATPSPAKEDLSAVWTSTAQSAWAAGAHTFLHHDGTAWSDASGVDGAPDGATFVGGSSETEGWAMTSTGAYHLSAK